MPLRFIQKLFTTQSQADTSPKETSKPSAQPAKPKAQSKKTAKAKAKKPSKPSWKLDSFVVPVEEGKTRFHDLNLPLELMHAISDLGFSYCTPIQAESLPATLAGHDAIGQAQTGTGKSAAFLLTILNYLLTVKPQERYASEPRALVIAPTRELALQIGKDAEALGKYAELNVVTVVGGMDYQAQRDKLRNEVVDVLVATPGRLIDFMNSRDVYLDQVDILVLDEADRMLDMGFIPDVRRIVRATPNKEERQTLLFSATFNFDVRLLIDQWTINPVKIEIQPEQVATDRVEQSFYLLTEDIKRDFLDSYLKEQSPERCILFANRRDICRDIHEYLKQKGYPSMLLTGEVNQQKRLKTLEKFRQTQGSIMVATDVAGRGIHVDGVSHVINYNLPEDAEDYVHRVGRTGRAGSNGVAISLIDEEDAFNFPQLESYLGKKLELKQV